MNNHKLVSIIIPVYNGGRFLKQAIESIFNQTYQDFELIIVDDGSTDNTKEIATSFSKVRYFYQENSGVASARNYGIKMAKGIYIALHDSDDIMLSNKLKLQIDFLEKNKKIDYCLGLCENFYENKNKSDFHYQQFKMEKEILALATLVTRREVYNKVGFYNTAYKKGSDFEWIVRANNLGFKRANVNEIILKRRIHNENLTLQNKESKQTLVLKILRDSITKRNE